MPAVGWLSVPLQNPLPAAVCSPIGERCVLVVFPVAVHPSHCNQDLHKPLRPAYVVWCTVITSTCGGMLFFPQLRPLCHAKLVLFIHHCKTGLLNCTLSSITAWVPINICKEPVSQAFKISFVLLKRMSRLEFYKTGRSFSKLFTVVMLLRQYFW